jgi:hypothetical protein
MVAGTLRPPNVELARRVEVVGSEAGVAAGVVSVLVAGSENDGAGNRLDDGGAEGIVLGVEGVAPNVELVC